MDFRKLTQAQLMIWESVIRGFLRTAFAHLTVDKQELEKLQILKELSKLAWGGWPDFSELCRFLRNSAISDIAIRLESPSRREQVKVLLTLLAWAFFNRKERDLHARTEALYGQVSSDGSIPEALIREIFLTGRWYLPGLTE